MRRVHRRKWDPNCQCRRNIVVGPRTHAQQVHRGIFDGRTDESVGRHVNEWTVDDGERGGEAVQLLLDEGAEAGIIPGKVEVEFVG